MLFPPWCGTRKPAAGVKKCVFRCGTRKDDTISSHLLLKHALYKVGDLCVVVVRRLPYEARAGSQTLCSAVTLCSCGGEGTDEFVV